MYWITTTDTARLARWERIFGSPELPVKTAVPRMVSFADRDRLAYDLDAGRLHEGQIMRYAAELSGRTDQMTYEDALFIIRAGQVTIPADNTELVTETAVSRPFLALWARLRAFFYALLTGKGRGFRIGTRTTVPKQA